MGRRRSYFDESALRNNGTYKFYLDRLTELSISMFEWKNLPDSVDSRFLESILFMNGSAVFFKDEDLSASDITGAEDGTMLALPVTMGGQFDVYNVPVNRRAYASNGYNKDLSNKDSVIVYNNMIRTNSIQTCTIYARRLWNLDRAIDVNANAQKTPVVIQCTDEQRLTLLNVYQKWEGNEPVIFGTDNLDMNGLKVLKTDAPYVARDLYELKTQIWNEALTYLGISNMNFQKRERLITDEVVRNQGGTIASRYSRLEARRKACKQINDMFGTNIEVYFRDDTKEFDETMDGDVKVSDDTSDPNSKGQEDPT
mgnify:CR=1 FL=1